MNDSLNIGKNTELSSYTKLRRKLDELYYKYNLSRYIPGYNKDKNLNIDEDIAKSMFFELILNIIVKNINKEIYSFTKEEINFIMCFHIDNILHDILFSIKGESSEIVSYLLK